ncbi:MAG: hypothetical protein J0H64_03955, partial [Actinobacteria bacterium]|nr:hypothetical protein [Actinomycetota bacterium]
DLLLTAASAHYCVNHVSTFFLKKRSSTHTAASGIIFPSTAAYDFGWALMPSIGHKEWHQRSTLPHLEKAVK